MNRPIDIAHEKIRAALMAHFQTIGITAGATKKAREHSHIFVPGELYGGRMGTLLCRKPWREKHVYAKGQVRRELCPRCAEVLNELVAVGGDLHARDLFAVAGYEKFSTLSTEDVGQIIQVRIMRQQQPQMKPVRLSLFEEQELTVPVRRTALWQLPSPQPASQNQRSQTPSSTSAATDR